MLVLLVLLASLAPAVLGEETVISFTSLSELLAARGAVVPATGAAVLAPGALYRSIGSDSVVVRSSLVVRGPSRDVAMPATLDLSGFTGLAFVVRAGASLELHNLTLLLPPLPADAASGTSASAVAHVVGMTEGSGARVLLAGVTLVMATQSDLFGLTRQLCNPDGWRYGTTELQVLRGVVLYGNGTMPLAAPPESSDGSSPPGAAAATSAILVDSSVTCAGGPPPPPWACSATFVADGEALRSTAEEMLAGTAGPVLLSLARNVTLQPGRWGGGGLVVPQGSLLGLYGSPEPSRAVQLDFAGISGAIEAVQGYVLIRQLVLLGLPYPPIVRTPKELLAAWVHAVSTGGRSGDSVRPWIGLTPGQQQARLTCDRCTLVLAPLEAALWCRTAAAPRPWSSNPSYIQGLALHAGCEDGEAPLLPNGSPQQPTPPSPAVISMAAAAQFGEASTSLLYCTLLPFSADRFQASEQAAAVGATWPMGDGLDTVDLAKFSMWRVATLEPATIDNFLAARCNPGSDVDTYVVSMWQPGGYVGDTHMPTRPWANSTALFTPRHLDDRVDWVPFYTMDFAWQCTLRGAPPMQTGRRTLWDMQGAVGRFHLRTYASSFRLQDMVLFNLAPIGPGLEDLGRPPPLPPAPPAAGPPEEEQAGGGHDLSPVIGPDAGGGGFLGGGGGGFFWLQPGGPEVPSPGSVPVYPPTLPPPQAPPPDPPEPPVGPPTPGAPPPAPPAAPLGPPAAPPLVSPLDSALANLSLPLWHFDVDRHPLMTDEQQQLVLRNITLIVPAPELALLQQLLRQAGVLPLVEQRNGSAAAAAGDGASTSNARRLLEPSSSRPSSAASRLLLTDPPSPAAACPHALLLSFAAASEVGWHTADTVFFRTTVHYGWRGLDITVTSTFPDDAPYWRMSSDVDLSSLLETACPQQQQQQEHPPAVFSASPATQPPVRPAAAQPPLRHQPTPSLPPPLDSGTLASAPWPPSDRNGAAKQPAGPLPPSIPAPSVLADAAGVWAAPSRGDVRSNPSSSTGGAAWVLPVAVVVGAGIAAALGVAIAAALVLRHRRRTASITCSDSNDYKEQAASVHGGGMGGNGGNGSLTLEVDGFPIVGASSASRNAKTVTANKLHTASRNQPEPSNRQQVPAAHSSGSTLKPADLQRSAPAAPSAGGFDGIIALEMHSTGVVRITSSTGPQGTTTDTTGAAVDATTGSGCPPFSIGAGQPSALRCAAASSGAGISLGVDEDSLLGIGAPGSALDASFLALLATHEQQVLLGAQQAVAGATAGAVLGDGGPLRNVHYMQGAAAARRPPAQGHITYRNGLPECPMTMGAAVERMRAQFGQEDKAVHLIRAIGQGSFGKVFLGLWCGQMVAAKMLVVHDDPYGMNERHVTERQCAILEAAVGTALGCHPNVVTTYAYDIVPLDVKPEQQPGQQQERAEVHRAVAASPWAQGNDVFQLCILQELCSGGSLKESLDIRGHPVAGVLAGGLAAVASLQLAIDVAFGLRHVHAAGIVHGDVSAGNVLLARRDAEAEAAQLPPAPAAAVHSVAGGDGTGPAVEAQGVQAGDDALFSECRRRLAHTYRPPLVAKVADFGLSVRVHGRTHASNRFQGTPLYVAPEVHSLGRVSKASDTYSFGVLLIEMIHGRSVRTIWQAHLARPLDAGVLQGHGAAESPLLAALHASLRDAAAGSCPPQLQALVASCLAPAASERPTMEQVIESLVDIVLLMAAT